MLTKITQSLAQNISPQDRIFRVTDTILKGFTLIVRPSGKKTWVVDYRKPDGSRTDHRIGPANLFTVVEAREAAKEFLSAIARGEDPTAPVDVLTYGAFLKDIYEPWVIENRRSGDSTVYMLKSNFKFLSNTPLEKITIAQIEQWRSKRRKSLKASSINRRITALKAALNWAVKRNLIESNPIAKLERLPEDDSDAKVRYLFEDERMRLLKALDAREKETRDARDSHNEWLKVRGLETTPKLNENEYVDHLKPLVLLSLSTGIRRNSLLSLEWRDVNFADRTIMIRAAVSKNQKQYYAPMNDDVFNIFTKWRMQSLHTGAKNLVFPSPQTGKKMDNCKKAWAALLKRANIQDFRWHDMRHDFASQLVMKGADLNTVRELMGHADLKMTLRYAHLAPSIKQKTVELLNLGVA